MTDPSLQLVQRLDSYGLDKWVEDEVHRIFLYDNTISQDTLGVHMGFKNGVITIIKNQPSMFQQNMKLYEYISAAGEAQNFINGLVASGNKKILAYLHKTLPTFQVHQPLDTNHHDVSTSQPTHHGEANGGATLESAVEVKAAELDDLRLKLGLSTVNVLRPNFFFLCKNMTNFEEVSTVLYARHHLAGTILETLKRLPDGFERWGELFHHLEKQDCFKDVIVAMITSENKNIVKFIQEWLEKGGPDH